MVTSDVLESLQPSLLARAEELAPGAGRDLLQEAYMCFVTHPPELRTATELKHWFRTTLRNLRAEAFKGHLINWR
jgi:DNA-directed RNA polymerase specialized sigma24 family protein